MKSDYRDIRDRIPEEPLWYDVNGVPRYTYRDMPKKLIGRIKCQSCGRVFRVSPVDNVYHISGPQIRLAKRKLSRKKARKRGLMSSDAKRFGDSKLLRLARDWGYGDPPAHNCAGDSMSAISEREWPEYFGKTAKEPHYAESCI